MTEAPPPEPSGAASAPERKGDRTLLVVLWAYVAVLLVAAFAQITGNRALLDLFDLRRLFQQ